MKSNNESSSFEKSLNYCGAHKDVLCGAFFGVLGAAIWVYGFSIKGLFSASGIIDSGFFPKLLGILFVVLSICLIVQDLLKQKKKEEKVSALYAETVKDMQKIVGVSANEAAIEAESKIDTPETRRESRVKVWITIFLLLFYVVALKSIGFIVTSTGYIFAQALVLTAKEKRKKYALRWLFIAAVTSIGVYYLFRYVLFLFLPAGILG